VLLDAVAAPRQITRLILSAEFGNSEQTTTTTLHKFVSARPQRDPMPCKIVNLESDAAFVSRSCPSVQPSSCAAYEVEADNVDLATLAELPPSIRQEIERQMLATRRQRERVEQQSRHSQQFSPCLKRKATDLKDFFSGKRNLMLGQTASELVVVDD